LAAKIADLELTTGDGIQTPHMLRKQLDELTRKAESRLMAALRRQKKPTTYRMVITATELEEGEE
jgi:hypothetical protein